MYSGIAHNRRNFEEHNKQIMRSCFISLSVLCLLSLAAITGSAQKENKQEGTGLVNSGQYIFHADQAMPLRGGVRLLTTPYTVKISADSIISDLPYFGRAYGGIDILNQSDLSFVSTNFSYERSNSKNGRYEVIIKIRDNSESPTFSLSIGSDGFATLQVNSNNRDAISFTGNISPWKRVEK